MESKLTTTGDVSVGHLMLWNGAGTTAATIALACIGLPAKMIGAANWTCEHFFSGVEDTGL